MSDDLSSAGNVSYVSMNPQANKNFTIEELLDALIYHWSFWDSYESYYLNELAPKLIENPAAGDAFETKIFNMLKILITEEMKQNLPQLIRQRRAYYQHNRDLITPIQGTVRDWLEARERQIDVERRKVEEQKRETESAAKAAFAEKERQRQEKIRRYLNERKEKIKGLLQPVFAENYLRADAIYQSEYKLDLSEDEYLHEKAIYIQRWVQKELNALIDLQQAAAIGAVNSNVLVVARAGSGKTSTLVYRAFFLQKHCGVKPNEILLLAFNRKAADEIKNRLSKLLQKSIPHVMTFHALAYALVHPNQELLSDIAGSENQALSRAVQSIIDDHLQIPRLKENIRNLMLAHFREAWERIEKGHFDCNKDEFLEYRRSIQKQSLQGHYVKSFGEKVIADFLFEHDIRYIYERNLNWNGINYKPDFTLFRSDKEGLIIEYFGMAGDADYDKMTEEKREYWRSQKSWKLLEIFPRHIEDKGIDNFRKRLQTYLRKNGFACTRLSEDEIWRRVKERAIDQFTEAVRDFVTRCRKRWLSENELSNLIAQHPPISQSETVFLKLMKQMYSAYLSRLRETNEEDFDGLMQRAVMELKKNETGFSRKNEHGDIEDLRYVLIDEFQDFSDLFYQLVAEMKRQRKNMECFCVGDDWQAINSFAGSDVKYFQHFENYFAPCRRLEMSTNYRSSKSIVDAGNDLMKGCGPPAKANSHLEGEVLLADLSTFQPTHIETERHPGDIITPAVLRLIKHGLEQQFSVVMLARTNRIPDFVHYPARYKEVNSGLDTFLNFVQEHFAAEERNRISISTVHKYKGLESSFVILLDAMEGSFPLLHPNSVFLRLFGDTPAKICADEKRLLYVALTRAAKRLIVITEKKCRSRFLTNIHMPELDWDEFPPLRGKISRLTIKICNPTKYDTTTFGIKELLKAEGYRWKSTDWKGWIKSHPSDNFDIKQIQNELWAAQANGVTVYIQDEDERLLATYIVAKGHWRKKA